MKDKTPLSILASLQQVNKQTALFYINDIMMSSTQALHIGVIIVTKMCILELVPYTWQVTHITDV